MKMTPRLRSKGTWWQHVDYNARTVQFLLTGETTVD